MKEKKIEKKDHDEWLKGLTAKKFREVFVEWYLPAIRSKFITLEDRIKKLEKPGKCGVGLKENFDKGFTEYDDKHRILK